MGMVVRSNVMAINAFRQLGANNNQVSKSLEKLSSGFRINRAGDDASGLAISEKMKAQIKGLETASSNSQDGISLIQTAEGALTEVHDMLNRMVELSGKAANGTMDANVDRQSLQKEVDALKSEIDRIARGTNFNGIKLLDGSLGAGVTVKAGTAGAAHTGTAAGADGTATETVLDFTKMAGNFSAGATVTVGNKTFEFVKAGGAAQTANAVAVEIGADKNATLTKLATAITDAKDDIGATGLVATATAADGKLTIKSADPKGGQNKNDQGAAAFAAPEVKTTGIGLTLQIGDTADDYNKITVSVADMSTKGLKIDDLDVSDQDKAAAALSKLRDLNGGGAINAVSTTRADLGALQNRLEHTISNLDVAAENMTNANSRIRDTDMAKQMMEYTKMNVLTQAAQAMLAQANQQPQSVLQLLQ